MHISKQNVASRIHLVPCICDSLMAAWLIPLVYTDMLYRDKFLFYASSWLNDWVCKGISELAMYSIESSTTTSFVSAAEQVVATVWPFQAAVLLGRGLYIFCCLWLLNLIFAIVRIIMLSPHSPTCLVMSTEVDMSFTFIFIVGALVYDALIWIATTIVSLYATYVQHQSAHEIGRPLTMNDYMLVFRNVLGNMIIGISWCLTLGYFVCSFMQITQNVMDWLALIGMLLKPMLDPIHHTFITKAFENMWSLCCKKSNIQ